MQPVQKPKHAANDGEEPTFAQGIRKSELGGVSVTDAGTLDHPIGGRRQVQVLILTPTSLPPHTLILKLRSNSQVAGSPTQSPLPSLSGIII